MKKQGIKLKVIKGTAERKYLTIPKPVIDLLNIKTSDNVLLTIEKDKLIYELEQNNG